MNYPHDQQYYGETASTTIDEPIVMDEESDQPQTPAAEEVNAGAEDEAAREQVDEAAPGGLDEPVAGQTDEAAPGGLDEPVAGQADEAAPGGLDEPVADEEADVVEPPGDEFSDQDADVVVLAEVVEMDDADDGAAADYELGDTSLGSGSAAVLSAEWHDIQATFVDDPRGAVQLAADAAESAISALANRVRDRRSTLMTTNADSPNQDTERLRFALQQYRQMCQAVAGLGQPMSQG